MKKVIFILLAVILVVSSGVQIQAAELPFVPDGEETTSEVPSQTLTLNAPSPAQASPPTRDSGGKPLATELLWSMMISLCYG